MKNQVELPPYEWIRQNRLHKAGVDFVLAAWQVAQENNGRFTVQAVEKRVKENEAVALEKVRALAGTWSDQGELPEKTAREMVAHAVGDDWWLIFGHGDVEPITNVLSENLRWREMAIDQLEEEYKALAIKAWEMTQETGNPTQAFAQWENERAALVDFYEQMVDQAGLLEVLRKYWKVVRTIFEKNHEFADGSKVAEAKRKLDEWVVGVDEELRETVRLQNEAIEKEAAGQLNFMSQLKSKTKTRR